MTAPDHIADRALLTVSAWQRETPQQIANRLLWRDQAERWEANDNTTADQYEARLDAVRSEMGREEILRKVNAPGRVTEVAGS
jgi:hypothetical protein